MVSKATEVKAGETARSEAGKIHWDDSQMRSGYANVCNVSSTREEVVLLFGINQSWSRAGGEVKIQLTDRIILSPFVAKSLAGLLNNVIREYEGRYGTLVIEGTKSS